MNVPDPDALDHFLDLAMQGREQGCSSGEWAALQLAQAVSEYAPRLDDEATRGLQTFLGCARREPGTCRSLFGGLAAMR
jgi:hypothetical protein